MTMIEHLKKAGISDEEIINAFQFKAGGYTKNGKRSYSFGSSKKPETFWGEIHFNSKGELYKIVPGNQLASEKSQLDFVKNTQNDIHGNHGHLILHRILFSQKPLNGKFQWKDDFRIKPCLNNSQIGKGLAWGVDDLGPFDTNKHLGPPFPLILEVRTKRSPNSLIETNRYLEALDLYEWLLRLLIPHIQGSPVSTSQPKWMVLQKENIPEYHLAYEGFNAHESELETGDFFSTSSIPDAPRYNGTTEYYNHLWVNSNEIELPTELENYLEAYDALTGESKDNFRRSLFWFNSGLRLYNQQELSLIPFVIAIECLLPNPSNEVCKTCKKPTSDGPTKLFNDFLKRHLSLPENIDHFKKSIYPKRSIMVHGRFARAADQGFFSIEEFTESEIVFESFIRRSLINWLIKGTCE
jgi:hypothetical protein